MKLAVIYNLADHKLESSAYSQTYKHMFDAMITHKGWESVQHITQDTHSDDIDADVIFIYDIHSCHHIKLEDLRFNPAIRYTYFNDPHQIDVRGMYSDGTLVHKLGAKNRIIRALQRGVNFIICPYRDGYNKFIAPYLGKDAEAMHVWFPVAPRSLPTNVSTIPLIQRYHKILGNGHTWKGIDGFRPYEFRTWAYKQPLVSIVPHVLHAKHLFYGNAFYLMLVKFAAALALTEWYVVPKYLEIPLAGCLCLAQRNTDYELMGFKDNEHCIYVDKSNFRKVAKSFLNDILFYQSIADNGRKLVENTYTAAHFADYIYKHSKEQIDGSSNNK